MKWDDPPAAIAKTRDEIPFLFTDGKRNRTMSVEVDVKSIADEIGLVLPPKEIVLPDTQIASYSPVDKDEYETVWEAIPNTSQAFAIDTRAQHTLYHGPRGPGKTITQLMRFRSRVGIGYGEYWRGIIFDREFKNLSDLVAQSNRFFPKFEDGAEWKKSQSEYKWVWPTGEELLFRHVKNPEDYQQFHGHEYPFIGWNELTKQPTSFLYDKFMSVNRSSFLPEKHTPKKKTNEGKIIYDTADGKPLPPIPLEVFSTTNPSGPGHNWVKKRFITCARNGEILKKEVVYFDPLVKKDVTVIRTQVAIFGNFYENIYLDPAYRAGLIEACQDDPHLFAAWVKGSWDVSAGGAFDDLWGVDCHVISRFKIPSNWFVDRTFDWGSTHPFSVIWWAEANGEEIEFEDGKKWAPPRGTLFAIDELYGSRELGTNKGLKLSADEICDLIIEKEHVLTVCEFATKISPGPADNQIRNVTESDVDTIEKKMSDRGIRWQSSDKSKGSRKIGVQLMRERLRNSKRAEGPGIYFFRNCEACIELIPTLPRDEKEIDDVDTDAEDHLWDATRYRVLKGSNRLATNIQIKWNM